MLFYISPILYVTTLVPEQYRDAYMVNPLATLLTEMRAAVVDPAAPHAWDLASPAAARALGAIGATAVGLGTSSSSARRRASRRTCEPRPTGRPARARPRHACRSSRPSARACGRRSTSCAREDRDAEHYRDARAATWRSRRPGASRGRCATFKTLYIKVRRIARRLMAADVTVADPGLQRRALPRRGAGRGPRAAHRPRGRAADRRLRLDRRLAGDRRAARRPHPPHRQGRVLARRHAQPDGASWPRASTSRSSPRTRRRRTTAGSPRCWRASSRRTTSRSCSARTSRGPDASHMIKAEMERHFAVWGATSTSSASRSDLAAYRHFPGRYTFFSDVNGCVARWAWQRIPYRAVPYAEDQLLGREMIEAGFAKVFHPGARVLHSHDYPPRAVPAPLLRRVPLAARGARPRRARASAATRRGPSARSRATTSAGCASTASRAASCGARSPSSYRHHAIRQAGAIVGTRADRLPRPLRRVLSLDGRDSFTPYDVPESPLLATAPTQPDSRPVELQGAHSSGTFIADAYPAAPARRSSRTRATRRRRGRSPGSSRRGSAARAGTRPSSGSCARWSCAATAA